MADSGGGSLQIVRDLNRIECVRRVRHHPGVREDCVAKNQTVTKRVWVHVLSEAPLAGRIPLQAFHTKPWFLSIRRITVFMQRWPGNSQRLGCCDVIRAQCSRKSVPRAELFWALRITSGLLRHLGRPWTVNHHRWSYRLSADFQCRQFRRVVPVWRRSVSPAGCDGRKCCGGPGMELRQLLPGPEDAGRRWAPFSDRECSAMLQVS